MVLRFIHVAVLLLLVTIAEAGRPEPVELPWENDHFAVERIEASPYAYSEAALADPHARVSIDAGGYRLVLDRYEVSGDELHIADVDLLSGMGIWLEAQTPDGTRYSSLYAPRPAAVATTVDEEGRTVCVTLSGIVPAAADGTTLPLQARLSFECAEDRIAIAAEFEASEALELARAELLMEPAGATPALDGLAYVAGDAALAVLGRDASLDDPIFIHAPVAEQPDGIWLAGVTRHASLLLLTGRADALDALAARIEREAVASAGGSSGDGD